MGVVHKRGVGEQADGEDGLVEGATGQRIEHVEGDEGAEGHGGVAARHLRCDAMRCDAMQCNAMRCDAMRWCDAMR